MIGSTILIVMGYSIFLLRIDNIFFYIYKYVFSLFALTFLPGSLLLPLLKLKFSFLQFVGTSITLGILTSTTIYFGLGLVGYQQGMIAYVPLVLLVCILHAPKFIKYLREILPRKEYHDLPLYFELIFLTFVSIYLFIPSGIQTDGGMVFVGPHIDDSMVHLGIIEQLKIAIPPEDATMAGSYFVYHFFNDTFHALISTVTGVSPSLLFFRFQFSFLVPLLGLISYVSIFRLTEKRKIAYLFSILLFFIGDFSYLPGAFITFLKSGFLYQRWDNLFFSPFNSLFFENQGFLFSLIIFFSGLLFFKHWLRERDKWAFFLAGLFWGVSIEYEIVLYLILMSALFFGGVFSAFYERSKVLLRMFLVSVGVSLPFVIFNFMIAYSLSSEKLQHKFWVAPFLNYVKLSSRVLEAMRLNGETANEMLVAAVVVLLILGSLGIRIFGFPVWMAAAKEIRNKLVNNENILLFLMSVLSFVFGNILIFKNKPTATLLGHWYFIAFMSFYGAIGLYQFIGRRKSRMVWTIFLCIVSTLPFIQYLFFGSRALYTVVTSEEIKIVEFVRNHTPEDAVFLSNLFDRKVFVKPSKEEIIHKGRNFIFTGLSGRKVVIGGLAYKDLSNELVNERIRDTEALFSTDQRDLAISILRKYDVDYVVAHNKPLSFEIDGILNEIYSNQEFIVYEGLKTTP
jgi:hypothetical protein